MTDLKNMSLADFCERLYDFKPTPQQIDLYEKIKAKGDRVVISIPRRLGRKSFLEVVAQYERLVEGKK